MVANIGGKNAFKPKLKYTLKKEEIEGPGSELIKI